MNDYAYPVANDTFGPEELAAAQEVLASGRFTMGPRVREFETAFAEWVGSPHAVMVNSGSSANLLMVEAMLRGSGVAAPWQPGDEVLVPALAWPTTVWPLVQLGLTPVFTDIDPDTLAIDLASAESVLSDKTRGMFLIHVLGQPPDMAAVADFNRAHGIQLLEDTCEALGSHAAGQHAGTIGLMGSFSFYFSHHLTTIEGGMVTTSSEAISDDLRSMRSHGWARDRGDRQQWVDANPQIDPRFLFIGTGYNLRPTEINAAIGLVQLDRLDDMVRRREELAALVTKWIAGIPWLRLIGAERLAAPALHDHPWREHSWMMLAFEVGEDAPVDLAAVVEQLEASGIETRPIVAGNLVRHPAMDQIEFRAADSLAAADRILKRGFMIGCHPVAEPAELEHLEAAFSTLENL
jgi:CDP-6-deoxy-D-xylo-4-hexulose-3-dehydrase